MQSGTSFFNRRLFRKTVTRFWPVWFLYALVWMLDLPVNLGGSIARSLAYSNTQINLIYALERLPLAAGTTDAAIICGIFSCLAAMGAYSHLYSARSAGAYAALPIRREGVFLSVTLAGLLPMLLIHLAVFAAALLTEAAAGVMTVGPLLSWLALVSMLTLTFFGLAALCAQLTGSIVVLPFVYFIFNFLAYVVQLLVTEMLGVFVYGYTPVSTSFTLFSPIPTLTNASIGSITVYDAVADTYTTTGFYFDSWGLVGAYAGAGLLLLTGAFFLYRKRQMETAGDVVAVRCLKPVFKYCMTFGGALALGMLTYALIFSDLDYAVSPGRVLAFTGFLLAGGFIGYFGAEMLIRKSVRVFDGRKCWLGFAVSCALLILTMTACRLDLFGYERRVPAASEVESVTLSCSGWATLEAPENIDAALRLHSDIVAHKGQLADGDDTYTQMLLIEYQLTDGKTLTRQYELAYGDDALALQDLLNVQEALEDRKSTEYPITELNIDAAYVSYSVPDGEGSGTYEQLDLSPAEALELYTTCILPDLAEGTLGHVWLYTDDTYLDTVYACEIRIECFVRNTDEGYQYQSFYTVPTTSSLRTNAWLEAHGVTLYTERACGTVSDTAYIAALPARG